MASNFVGVDVRGLPELRRLLDKLPEAVQDFVVDDVANYLINVYQSEQPPRRHVSRAQAYPGAVIRFPSGATLRGYQSMAQFRMIMALVGEGKTPYKRTQELRRGWKKYGTGKNALVANENEAAPWTMGPEQSNHERLVGWKKVDDINEDRRSKIEAKAAAAAEKGMRKAGAK